MAILRGTPYRILGKYTSRDFRVVMSIRAAREFSYQQLDVFDRFQPIQSFACIVHLPSIYPGEG
jgi:hypothetical protein